MDCIIQEVFTFSDKFLFFAIYLFVVDWQKQLTFFLLKLVEVKYQAVNKAEGAEQWGEPFESSILVCDGDERLVVYNWKDAAVEWVGHDKLRIGER